MLKKTFLGVLFVVFVSGLLIAGINFNVTKAGDYGSSGTPVGGIIWENTTWTLESSPYIITATIQIPNNVTLTIEPGVTVISNLGWRENMFLLNGIIHAHGTADSRITFDGGGDSNFFLATSATGDTFLDLDYCIIRNGNTFFGSEYAHLNLTHSVLEDLYEPSSLYPVKNSFIEHNFFKNFCSFMIATGGTYGSYGKFEGSVYIRYNLFIGRSGFWDDKFYTIMSTGNYDTETCNLTVEYNSFLSNNKVLQLLPGFDRASMSAPNSYWGTTNTSIIDSMIYDKKDDITCAGFIEYLPILTEPHPDTPTLPLTVNFTYSPSVVYAYGAVTFDATASFGPYSSVANYTWDFGDGNITTTLSPTVKHTYTTPDSYNVTLTVTDEFGFQNSTVTSLTVHEDYAPPMIGVPSRIPEGDVEPDQKVKVLVNVTDSLSGIKNVTLSYNLNDSTIWIDSPMTLNSTTGLYETAIQVQQAHTLVRYEITAYDNAGNHMVEDNSGQYYVYTVIPEFTSTIILPVFMLTTLLATVLLKKKRKTKIQLP